jgi:hypothetical protein
LLKSGIRIHVELISFLYIIIANESGSKRVKLMRIQLDPSGFRTLNTKMSVFCLVPKIVLWKGVGQVPLIQNLLQAQRVLNPRVVLTKRFSLWTRKRTGTVVRERFEVYVLNAKTVPVPDTSD